MTDQYLQATIEIVSKMIEHNKIQSYGYPNDLSKQNETYLQEVAKAIKTVYQTVSNPLAND